MSEICYDVTPSQAKRYQYYWKYFKKHGYVPLQSEAAEHFGVDHQAIHTWLRVMNRKGILEHHHYKKRGVTLLVDPKKLRVDPKLLHRNLKQNQ